MRNKEEFIGMDKSSVTSQLKTLKDAIVHGSPHYDMYGLVDENVLAWIFRNVLNLGNSHYPYQHYTAETKGIFQIPGGVTETSIALLSDWASDTPESHLIAAQCGTQDYSIHLGDTYYVGNDKEIAYNFSRTFGSWPYGRLGSFAMLGNHEMYSSGKSYFTQLLPFMGSYEEDGVKVMQKQEASYFCLENQYWRIIALDTGYYSLKGFFGLRPNENLDLHEEQKQWLEHTVRLGNTDDKRGIIILSHHQVLSAFESEFSNPMSYISGLLGSDRKIIWLCGHEHWCSVYGANKMPNGSAIYTRCIGNSGMPVELNRKQGAKLPKGPAPTSPANRNLVLYDNRLRERFYTRIPLGHNGYVLLKLNADELKIQYLDDNDRASTSRLILEETWNINTSNGHLTGKTIVDHTQANRYQLCQFSVHLTDAID